MLLFVACYTLFDGEPALDISKDKPFSPTLLRIIIQAPTLHDAREEPLA